MGLIENLLLFYIGALLINVLLSAILWYRDRSALHRDAVYVWGSSVLTFAIQGVASGSEAQIAFGFVSAFAVTAALIHFLSNVVAIKVPWRWYLGGLVAALLTSAVCALVPLRFEIVSLPIAMAVALPLIDTAIRARRRHADQLTTPIKLLLYTCILNGVHLLDFPFLRNREDMAPAGFTLAMLMVFSLSVTLPGVVLERIAAERARIEQIDRTKTQFFANISHELRTPLTVVLASVEQLLAGGLQDGEKQDVEIIRKNAARQLKLIDEMLDLTKIDAGGLRLDVASFSLRTLVNSICENNHPLAAVKSIELVLKTDGPEIPEMYGDPHRLEIVVANLVSNALKYTQNGGRIEVSVRDAEDGAFVSVEDNGRGIGAEDLPHVFERFFQVHLKEPGQGGVGIGLALAKELTELHGGSLSVKSELGKGSVFTLWLPKGREHIPPELVERRKIISKPIALRRAEDRTPVPSRPDLGPLQENNSIDLQIGGRRPRLLVVEDQDELRRFITRIFSGSFEVMAAADGEEGWEAVQKERPDLVVSDVMMPRRLGTDLCRAIKSDPNLRATAVILLTARIGSDATLEAYAHGADDFVAKPFHPQVLLARVRAQLQIRSLSLQLASQEKLAAIGTLAAGVAHEVKNPLNFIMNATRVLLDDPDPDSAQELMKVIAEGAQRIEGIVSALSSHARPADSGAAPATCDLKEGLEATLRLLAHRMRDVELEREYRTEQKAWAPPGPVNQVLMNLLDNAVRSGASKIWVRLLTHHDRVRVHVADNGPGVPNEIAERIFDPFFTTRPPGEGTGLGLYLSRKIAADCGGSLTLERRPGGGAEFQLELPQVMR